MPQAPQSIQPNAGWGRIASSHCLTTCTSVPVPNSPPDLCPALREHCAEAQEKFLQRCFYQAGSYDASQAPPLNPLLGPLSQLIICPRACVRTPTRRASNACFSFAAYITLADRVHAPVQLPHPPSRASSTSTRAWRSWRRPCRAPTASSSCPSRPTCSWTPPATRRTLRRAGARRWGPAAHGMAVDGGRCAGCWVLAAQPSAPQHAQATVGSPRPATPCCGASPSPLMAQSSLHLDPTQQEGRV